MTAIQSKKQIKAELAKIDKKLANLGLNFDGDQYLFFLKSIPRKNCHYGNANTDPMLAEISYDSDSMQSCCGIIEFSELNISDIFNKDSYKNVNFNLTGEIQILMYQYLFLQQKYCLIHDTFKGKIRGQAIIYVSNHEDDAIDKALSSLSGEFSKQDVLINRGSNNLLTVYISKH